MSAPEFRLQPWEHRGIEPAPTQQFEARIEGRLRRFDVKTREDRAYFRFADERDERDERVWTLPEPLAGAELEPFFGREVGANRVARFFCVERGFSTQTVRDEFQTELRARFHASNLRLFGPTRLAVAVRADGRGLAQEWCGGAWFPFVLPARSSRSGARTPSIWSRSWNAAGLKGTLAHLAGDFAFRPFAPDAFGAQPLHFARGSQAELEKLFRALCVLVAPQHAPTKTERNSQSSVHFRWLISAQTHQSQVFFTSAPFTLTDELLRLFLADNAPVGASWEEVGNRWFEYDEQEDDFIGLDTPPAPTKRIDFEFAPHSIKFQWEVAVQPSAHEQLEAKLTLRDWARDTGHSAPIEELLA